MRYYDTMTALHPSNQRAPRRDTQRPRASHAGTETRCCCSSCNEGTERKRGSCFRDSMAPLLVRISVKYCIEIFREAAHYWPQLHATRERGSLTVAIDRIPATTPQLIFVVQEGPFYFFRPRLIGCGQFHWPFIVISDL
jgi:hypothetical protein